MTESRKLAAAEQKAAAARHAWRVFVGQSGAKRGTDPLVGVSGVAAMLGTAKPNVIKLRDRGLLPEPCGRASGGPLYLRAEVEALRVRLDERARADWAVARKQNRAGV